METVGQQYVGTGARQANVGTLITSGSGLHIGTTIGTAPIRFYTGGIDADDLRMMIDKDGNVGIGTTTPGYPLEVNDSIGASYISIYASKNISATGYITRTSVYDKSQGNALDKVKDADNLKTAGEIDHSKSYGYVSYEVTDFSRPEVKQSCFVYEETGMEYCEDVAYYPYNPSLTV